MKKVTIVKNGEKFFESNNYFNYYEEVIINYAYLRGADLSGADLSRADLSGADLSGADLRGADLSEDEEIRKGKILEKEIVGYKKCKNN